MDTTISEKGNTYHSGVSRAILLIDHDIFLTLCRGIHGPSILYGDSTFSAKIGALDCLGGSWSCWSILSRRVWTIWFRRYVVYIYITGAYVLRIKFLVFPHLSFASGRMPYLSGKRRPLFAVSRCRLNSHYTPEQYHASGRRPTLGRSQRILSEPLLYTPRIGPRLGLTRQHTTASHWSRCKDYRHTHTRQRPK